MSSVRLEVVPWLNRYFAAEEQGRVVLEWEVDDGATVRDFLEEVASQNQELKKVLFDAKTGGVAGYICVILNDRLLELAGGVEAELRPGDVIRLMPGFSGG